MLIMYSSRLLPLLSFLFAVLCLADAALVSHSHLARSDLLDNALKPTGDASQVAATDAGLAATTPSSTSSPSTSSTSTESSTDSPTTSSTDTPSESSVDKIAPSPTVSTKLTSSASIPTSNSTPTIPDPQNTDSPSTSQQSFSQSSDATGEPTSSHQPAASTIIATVTSTSTDAAQTPNDAPKTSSTPDLNSDKNTASSGMPPKTRNTVIGVVVSVCGAILLGALGMVAYRIWGRKKSSEENDGLMSYDMGNSGYEKQELSASVNGSQRTPFQSTLENYHQPSNVNASSNF